ncbi:MAG TPA: TonB-dependent receptor, partial [Bacteroidia bacterium]|nr:TonB-dependent receptor [Bacteroidia bacterium]
ISSPVLTNISIQYEGFDAYETDPISVPDLFADRPLIITGKYRGKAEGKISVSGITGTNNYTKEISVDSVKPRKQNKAIRLLWARERVKYLSYLDGGPQMSYYGYNSPDTSVGTEITAIGMKYGMLTNYTSFIAVDHRVRNKTGEGDSAVQQPVPMPYGMDNSAISMSGTLQEVTILSLQSIVGCSGSYSSIIIRMPEPVGLPVTANALQDPQPLQDVNGFYHGRLVHSNAMGYDRPFFTPGASGRIFSAVTTDMLKSYNSLAGQNSAASVGFSPMRSYGLAFSTREEGRGRISLSGTHLGAQNLYFNHYTQLGNKIYSQTQISQQWKGTSTDRNDDGFEDVPRVFAVTGFHMLQYNSQSTKPSHLTFFTNELMVHHSNMQGGQVSTDAVGAYTTSDRAMGIYVQPRFGFELRGQNWLTINSSFAAASLDAAFGIDRYHSRSLLAFTQINNDLLTGDFIFNYGAGFHYADGEESWNHLRLDLSNQLVTAHGNATWRNLLWTVAGGVRFEYDSKFKEIILPNASVNYIRDKFSVRIAGKRYRNPQLAVGQLLPLMYSSRELSVSPGLRPDEGWYFNTQFTYHNNGNSVYWLATVDYGIMMQSNTTVIDLYSDARMISVYSIKNRLLHRITARSEIRFSSRWRVQIEYTSLISVLKYGNVELQQPLTPNHQGYMALNYGSYDTRLSGRLALQYTGSQLLPQQDQSPQFATVNLGFRYKVGVRKQYEFFVNAFNLLDYRQKNVLFGTQPTDQSFDGWMTWGPVAGRSVQFGVTLKL